MCPFKAFEHKENRISIYDKTQKILVALKNINWGLGTQNVSKGTDGVYVCSVYLMSTLMCPFNVHEM